MDSTRLSIDANGNFTRVTRVSTQLWASELEIDIEDFHHQQEGLEPAQAPTEFVTALAFKDSLLGVLNLFLDTS